MRYQGSEAYSVDAAERRRERPYSDARPSFEVVTGGGLDARARQGVSPQFVARVRAVVAVACALIALGLVRVALTAATVSVLESNATLSEQIQEAQSLSSNLSVERSVLSSNARISRIATQNYGMVFSADRVSVTFDDGTSADAAGDADTDASATADDAGTTSDGDAAQTGSEAGGQPSVD